MEKPVAAVGFLGAGTPQARAAADARQPGDVDAIGAAHQRDDRRQLTIVTGRIRRRHEDEALDDLTQLHADGIGRFLGGVGRFIEGHHLDLDPVSSGGLSDAFVSGMGGSGHACESRTSPTRGAGVGFMDTSTYGTGERQGGAESAGTPQTLGT